MNHFLRALLQKGFDHPAWHKLFTIRGTLRKDWLQIYCDMLQNYTTASNIPEGGFRTAWIGDCLREGESDMKVVMALLACTDNEDDHEEDDDEEEDEEEKEEKEEK